MLQSSSLAASIAVHLLQPGVGMCIYVVDSGCLVSETMFAVGMCVYEGR